MIDVSPYVCWKCVGSSRQGHVGNNWSKAHRVQYTTLTPVSCTHIENMCFHRYKSHELFTGIMCHGLVVFNLNKNLSDSMKAIWI